jgi:60S ribosome subunit biogenesis protein NIP7
MIRDLTREETTSIRREFNKWGIFNCLIDKVFTVKESDDNSKSIFIIPLRLKKLMFYPYSCYGGSYIGSIQKKKFIPSIAFFDMVAKHSNNFLYVIVDCNGEKLTLYGRDIFGNSILYASQNIEENSILLILNQSKELLGIGKARFQTTKIKQNGKVTITTLLDLGTYLRSESHRNKTI